MFRECLGFVLPDSFPDKATLNAFGLETGMSLGEIALLLGENRSATLRAMNNVVLTKISQKDLKDISGSESPLFFEIAKSLSQKHINNIASIHSINESVISRNLGFDDEELRKKKQNDQRAEMELSSLKKVVSDAFFKKDPGKALGHVS